MNTPIKLAAFAGALAIAFAAALGAGAALGSPVGAQPEGHDAGTAGDGGHAATPGTHGAAADGGSRAAEVAGGLMVAQDGYRLVLDDTVAQAGEAVEVSFRVLDESGDAVTAFEENHTEDLHLVVVRRDLTGFQHVHPTMDARGRWSTRVDLTAGTWRVFADFVPAAGARTGRTTTLGADLQVAGDVRPAPLPGPAALAQVDGYTVELDGELVPGTESELTLTVSRDGRPVTDLDPYLAAYGHLVALRAGDLAYLHVHPAGEPGDGVTEAGPGVTFFATAPSAGDYRLFLDFQHRGVVRTAELTAQAHDAGH